jgi:hypothetical protein
MSDIQFDRILAIAPAGEPHVRNSSDAPARQDTSARQQAKHPHTAENPEPDKSEIDADSVPSAEDTEPPHTLDRFA